MPGTCPHTQAHSYCRREPEKHPLYQVLAQHLETFLQRTRTDEHQLPDHVEQELRAYLKCGILYVQSEVMYSWSIFSCDDGIREVESRA